MYVRERSRSRLRLSVRSRQEGVTAVSVGPTYSFICLSPSLFHLLLTSDSRTVSGI